MGTHLLAVCAVDEYGASACVSQSVTIQAPSTSTSSSAMVAASVAAINVTELVGSGDASSLQDAARQLASVVAFAASSGGATDVGTGMASAVVDLLMEAMAANLDTEDTEQVCTTQCTRTACRVDVGLLRAFEVTLPGRLFTSALMLEYA